MTEQARHNDEDYLVNAKGHLCPKSSISTADLLREEYVQNAIKKAEEMQQKLAAFKEEMMSEAEEFYQMLAAEHGVKTRSKRGALQLRSFDGKLKVSIAVQDRITMDEKLKLAKEILDELMTDWAGNADPNLLIALDDYFRTDSNGQVNPRLVLSLRRKPVKDPSGRWDKAMNLISDSIQVIGSSQYIRFHKRDADDNNIERQISLDLSKL